MDSWFAARNDKNIRHCEARSNPIHKHILACRRNNIFEHKTSDFYLLPTENLKMAKKRLLGQAKNTARHDKT
jgi:hypothetical protein